MDGWEKGGELKPLDISKEVVTKIEDLSTPFGRSR